MKKNIKMGIMVIVLCLLWPQPVLSQGGSSMQVGLYMTYGELKSQGNYLDNMLLFPAGNGEWRAAEPFYWHDEQMRANFYGYAPYGANIENALAHTFSVKTDQSTAEAQSASDFLWGRLPSQLPNTLNSLSLPLRHLFSRIIINVAPGEGFTPEELNNGTLDARIGGLRTQAVVNLSDGNVEAKGDAQTIIPQREADGLGFSAIIVPQQVAETGLVTIFWGGSNYTLKRAMTFASGKQYKLSLTLRKTAGGINVGIIGWEDTGEDYGGAVN